MAGINLAELAIPKSNEPIKRKHVVRLDELSNAYSNPELKKGDLVKPDPLQKVDKKLEVIEKKTQALLDKAEQRVKRKEFGAKPTIVTDKSQLPTVKIDDSLSEKIFDNIYATKTTEAPQQAHIDSTHPLQQTRYTASYFDYLSMPRKKLPKQILDYVKDKHFVFKGEDYSSMDTFELIELTKKSAHQLSNAVARLEERGWFKIVQSSSAGHRTLKIDKELFGIK